MKKLLVALAALACSTAGQGAGFTSLDRPTARSLGDAASHQRPTIVALWSSDCVHCKKNLGLFAKVAKSRQDLRLVSVATEPESPLAAQMLDAIGLPGERYAYGSAAPEALAYALDSRWQGELPRTLLFDGKGGRVAVSGVVDEKTLVQGLGLGPGPSSPSTRKSAPAH